MESPDPQLCLVSDATSKKLISTFEMESFAGPWPLLSLLVPVYEGVFIEDLTFRSTLSDASLSSEELDAEARLS